MAAAAAFRRTESLARARGAHGPMWSGARGRPDRSALAERRGARCPWPGPRSVRLA